MRILFAYLSTKNALIQYIVESKRFFYLKENDVHDCLFSLKTV